MSDSDQSHGCAEREEIRRVFEEVYAQNVRTKDFQGYGEMYTEAALWKTNHSKLMGQSTSSLSH